MKDIFTKFSFRVGSEAVRHSKSLAPYRTGNLKKDIQVVSYNECSVTIGNSTLAPYAKYVYFGTKPYIIRPKKKKVLANKKAKMVFGKKVNHPGIKANAYLKKGVDRYMQEGGFTKAKQALVKDIKDMILRDVKRGLGV